MSAFASADLIDQQAQHEQRLASAAIPEDATAAKPRPFPTVDLAAVAKAGIPEPILLFHRLLYRGMLHSLAGPPDCGKSTIAYRAGLDELVQGNTVVVLDEEGGREVVVEKLLALGATPAHLEPSPTASSRPAPGMTPTAPASGSCSLAWGPAWS
jgi:AAA domain